MLLVYRAATGEVVDNSGTNSAFPDGPADDLAYVNTDAAGIDRDDLALLRLNDDEDAGLVAGILARGCAVKDGAVVLKDPPPPTPAPTPAIPEGTARLGNVKVVSPLGVLVDGDAEPSSASRHAGYSPSVDDRVQLTYLSGGWVVQDQVIAS